MFSNSLIEPNNLEQVIVYHPLIVTPDTLVVDVIAQMSNLRATCKLEDCQADTGYLLTDARASCVLIMQEGKLLGIFTERDVVRLSAEGGQITGVAIADVMTPSVITIQKSDFTDIFAALQLFQVYHIRHLPVLDDSGMVVGLLTHESLRQLLRPIDLLRLRLVSEVMMTQVIQVAPETTVLGITQLMASQQVSSVVIVEQLLPVGIITERDIVQFQAMGLDFDQIQVQAVMSTPVFTLPVDASLWSALVLMQEKRIHRVVITSKIGELVGIVTQTTLLQALNPIEMYKQMETLEQKVCQLEIEKLELLQSRNAELEKEVRQRTQQLQVQAERERLLSTIFSRIRASLDLQDTLDAIVTEVQKFLQCDRVYIYQFHPDWSGTIVAESTTPQWQPLLGRIIDDPCFRPDKINIHTAQGLIRIVPDIYQTNMSPCHRQLLEQLQIRAKIIVPIFQGGMLWGLLSAIEGNAPRNWESGEVELLQQLSTQVEIAIQQAKAYECSQVQLAELERMEREIRLLYTITQAISQVDDFHAALEVTLRQICEFTDWSFGEVWLPSPDNTHLQLSPAWYCSEPALESFRLTSKAITFLPNQGLPGRVWTSKTPEWILNVAQQKIEDFLRVDAAQKCGLKAAFGIPILAQEGVFAILVFFATEEGEVNESLLQLITSVAVQLGQIIQRKQIEAALSQSEHRYATLAEAAPVGIFRTDQTGACLYVNERWCEMGGLTLEAALGFGWMRALHPDDQEQILTEWNRCVQENVIFRLEYRFQRPDGKITWVFGQSAAELGADGQIIGYIGTVTDITDRKQAELDLQKLAEGVASFTGQDFFSAVAEYIATNLGVCYVLVTIKEDNFLNSHTIWSKGKIQPNISFHLENTPCNRAIQEGIFCCAEGLQQKFPQADLLATLGAESYLGIALTNIRGDVIGNLCILDDKPLLNVPRVTAMVKVFAARVSAELERQAAIAKLYQLNQELEARVEQRTAALRENEERWHLALQGSNDGIWDWNLKTNKVFFSSRWKEMRNFAEHEISDDLQEWSSRIHPEDYQRVLTAVADHFAGKTSFFQEEYRVQRKDGSYMWVSDRGKALWDENGNIVRMAGSETDITRRRQAEEQLLKSELHLSTAQRIANLGSWEFDLQTREISWSREIFHIFGLNPEAGVPSYEEINQLIHPDDRDRYNLIVNQGIESGQSYEVEYRLYRPDGSLRYLQARGEPVFDAQGKLVRLIGTALDITDRKHTEERLRNLTDRLTLALKAGSIGIWEWDILQDTLIWDDCMYELYGVQPSEQGEFFQIWANTLHPDDRVAAEIAIQDALSGKKEFDTEFRILRSDDTIRFIKACALVQRNEQGKPQRMIGLNFDMSDRKQIEETLKRQLTAIEAAVDGIAILQGDTYTYLNQAHLQLFGYTSPEELVGKTWLQLYSPAEISRIKQDVFPVLIQQHYWQGEATATRKDGSTFTEGLSLTLTDNGELICMCRDISEQKQAEEKLRQVNERLTLTNAELHRATHLKDEFLANMSHELRTPLNAILGMSEGLQEAVFGELTSRQQQAISTIERSGTHLLELINDILDLSKIESGKMELETNPVAVRYLCDSSLAFVRQQAIKKNLKLSIEVPANLPDLVVDERRIRQVLINLLNNAVKFTTDGGSVKLVVRLEQQQETDFICFCIIDTGIGIASENIDKLFQPFVQIDSSLNRQYTGTGLGLSLVRRLVELHGGRVTVTSEIGRGSCFRVYLPYTAPSSPCTQYVTQPTANIAFAADNSQVLIIEDSTIAAEHIARYLAEMGMQSHIYAQGVGAIDETLRINPTLIILDIQLPNLSGWEVLKQLKVHPCTRNIPIVLISVIDERSRGLSLGASDYLVKPFSREQFRNTLWRLQHPEMSSTKALIISPTVTPIEETPPALILLAEDNQANIATISSYLQARGYRLLLAKNGKEAVTLTKAQHPDLILMDIQMPEMDGLEAIRLIRAEKQLINIPIIALTALAMPGDWERCMAAGANDYFPKPVKLKRLVESVQNLLNQK